MKEPGVHLTSNFESVVLASILSGVVEDAGMVITILPELQREQHAIHHEECNVEDNDHCSDNSQPFGIIWSWESIRTESSFHNWVPVLEKRTLAMPPVAIVMVNQFQVKQPTRSRR